MKSIDLIAWAWPAEVIVVILYTVAAPAFMSLDFYVPYLQALPFLSALIAGQGAAAFFGKKQQDEQPR